MMAGGDFQKMLQLENIKKGMARKSSKENSSSAQGAAKNMTNLVYQ